MGKDDECEGAGLGPTLEGGNGPGKAFSSDDRGDCGERGVFMGDGSVATDGRRHSPYYVAFLSLSLSGCLLMSVSVCSLNSCKNL